MSSNLSPSDKKNLIDAILRHLDRKQISFLLKEEKIDLGSLESASHEDLAYKLVHFSDEKNQLGKMLDHAIQLNPKIREDIDFFNNNKFTGSNKKTKLLIILVLIALSLLAGIAGWIYFLTDPNFPKMIKLMSATDFKIGSPEDEFGRHPESNEDQKIIPNIPAFLIGKYEVTKGEFREFVESTGYVTTAEREQNRTCKEWQGLNWGDGEGLSWKNPGFPQDDNHPVVCVSWLDAIAYAEWLSKQTGYSYRLPTEAEWEYAARAGTTTSRYWGDVADKACDYANVNDKKTQQEGSSKQTYHFCNDGYARTSPVGKFKPNNFGLHDMLGNVSEWTCSARYSDDPQGGYKTDNNFESVCSNSNHKVKAARGGAWFSVPNRVRSAQRSGIGYLNSYNAHGFRVARDL